MKVMSRKILLIILALILVGSIGVSSQEMTIVSPDSSVIVYAGETIEINLPIKNEGAVTDTVYISIWPTNWVSLDRYRLTIPGGGTEQIRLSVTPPEDAEEGTHIFTVTTQSLDSNRTKRESLYLSVKRKTNVFISELKLDEGSLKPGEILQIDSVITNLQKTQGHKVSLSIKIFDGEDKVIEKFEGNVDLDPRDVKIIKNFYTIPDFQSSGEYSVKAQLRDSMNKLLDDDEKVFDVEEHFDVNEEESKDYGVLYVEKRIKVSNQGNVVSGDYMVEESLPKITKYFFYPGKEPNAISEMENRVIYTWDLGSLSPGEEKTITYRLRFFNVLIVFLVLVLLAMVIYEYVTKPLIRKKYYGILSGEDELKITLMVKNRKRSTLNDVIVKDVVPPMAKVIKKFDTREPKIKMTEKGTKLTWHIKKIKPKEEVVLTYKIKPLIDVIGKLDLPKSYFTYKGKFRRNKRVVSKSVSITGKIK